MIQYVKRSELDVKKYDLCIENSKNSRIYAFSWYLNIVADNWDVLILNDYEAVMPLPWRSKYFIKYIYPPCWTQQLGVFSSEDISVGLLNKFIEKIPKKFQKIRLNLNNKNAVLVENSTNMTNYILPLNKSYNELFEDYKSVRRRCRNQLNRELVEVFEVDSPQEIIRLFIQQKQKKVNVSPTDYSRLEELVGYLKRNNNVDIIIAKNRKGILLGGAFFIKDSKRITYLFSSISQEGRDEQVMTYIIDTIITQYADSSFTLDFEGSMIPGVAFFFKSFGAQEEIYFNFQKPFF